MKLVGRARRYLRPYRLRFGAALLLVGANAGLELARPWPLKITVDCVLGGMAPPALAGLDRGVLLALACSGLLLLQLAGAGLTFLLNRLSIEVGQRRVRSELRGARQRGSGGCAAGASACGSAGILKRYLRDPPSSDGASGPSEIAV
jgi:ABC-type multidrug transport system fused ATPase/permease subunit